MRSAVGRDTPKRSGIPIEDRYGVCTFHDLKLIRHAEGLGSGQWHAIGGPTGIVGATYGLEFLGAGFEDRPFGRGCCIATASRARTSVEIINPGKFRFPRSPCAEFPLFFAASAAATLWALGVVPATLTVNERVNT